MSNVESVFTLAKLNNPCTLQLEDNLAKERKLTEEAPLRKFTQDTAEPRRDILRMDRLLPK
jgi:hypothetical protein